MDRDHCQRDDDPHSLALDVARARIVAAIEPIKRRETVPLAALDGRVLAGELRAQLDVPPWPNSAMDGFACRRDDVRGERVNLRLVGRSLAGHPRRAALAPGEAIRVTTGAPLPDNATAVVMQERAECDGETLRFAAAAAADAGFVRARGSDVTAGERLYPAGTRLDPVRIAVLAAQGLATAEVFAQPRVVVLSSGDELVAAGERADTAQIYDSNRPMLLTLLARAGALAIDGGQLADQPSAIENGLRAAAERADLILSSGGVSVGSADHVRAALARCGSLGFWKIAVKPGRPLAFGRVGAAHYLGLPGNPVSSLVTFKLLVLPALAQLSGERPLPATLQVNARVAGALQKRPGRMEFQRALSYRDDDGTQRVRALGEQASHRLHAASEANCLIELDADSSGAADGEWVRIHPI